MSEKYICKRKICLFRDSCGCGHEHEKNSMCGYSKRIEYNCPQCEPVKQKKQTTARKRKWGDKCPWNFMLRNKTEYSSENCDKYCIQYCEGISKKKKHSLCTFKENK